MLTGISLGAAIESARLLKGVTKKAMAEAFHVAPPSIQDWVKRGTIDKEKLPKLWDYFSDVVGLDHWGLSINSPSATPVPNSHESIRFSLADSEPMPLALPVLLHQLGAHLNQMEPAHLPELGDLLKAWATSGGKAGYIPMVTDCIEAKPRRKAA